MGCDLCHPVDRGERGLARNVGMTDALAAGNQSPSAEIAIGREEGIEGTVNEVGKLGSAAEAPTQRATDKGKEVPEEGWREAGGAGQKA